MGIWALGEWICNELCLQRGLASRMYLLNWSPYIDTTCSAMAVEEEMRNAVRLGRKCGFRQRWIWFTCRGDVLVRYDVVQRYLSVIFDPGKPSSIRIAYAAYVPKVPREVYCLR